MLRPAALPSPTPAPLPRALYRARELRALDRAAIERFGIPGITLMERAATAALRYLRRRWPRARRVAVLSGHGNNGGDGLLLASLAAREGLAVRVGMVGDRKRLRGDAREALRRCEAAGVAVCAGRPDLSRCDLVVDAMLGTGLERAVRGPFPGAIERLAGHRTPVLSLDLPSGLSGDTGARLGATVTASATVTFLGLKAGLFTGHGPGVAGEIAFDDLGVPAALYEEAAPCARRMSLADFAGVLGPRPRHAHKNDFGHVLVVGGDEGMPGAPRLAAEGAARSGAGLVTVATRAVHAAAVPALRPELMAQGVESAAALRPLIERATVVAAGPGLGASEWSLAMLGAVLGARRPLVLDAGALHLVASGAAGAVPRGTVLTPHPGEAGRLLGCTSAAVEADRFAAVARIRERNGAVVVLKGAGSLVDDGEGPVSVCAGGNPGMASAGTGDVLCGVIAALMAQGLPPSQAARAGVCAHAAAGDRAARAGGERGMLAGDLAAMLRPVLNFR